MDDFFMQRSREMIQRDFNGITPQCTTCETEIPAYPYDCTVSRDGIECDDCYYRRVNSTN